MSWYWWALEGALSFGNGLLLFWAGYWFLKARTDRLKWRAYAALMGIEEKDIGATHKSLAAGDSMRMNVGSRRVDIFTSKTTELTVSIW